jgi:transposase
MELITILNCCHHFQVFVYQRARFSPDKMSIQVWVRPRKGSAAICSRCHQTAPGYDQLAERRFEFIPLWGFFVFLLYAMRRVDCRRCGTVAVEEVPWGDGKRSLTKAYMLFLLKVAFQQLWDYNSPAWAGKFLDEWCRQTMRSRIEPMKKIARSIRQHRELILNYFRAQKLISSGVVEGLNNKAKVTMRKSYGFRTYRVLELALYHSLGKLPEPELTHDFF